jgi:hypothetical protein
MKKLTLRLGQAVSWPHSPSGIAQVDELGRSRVRICYRTARGKLRFARVAAGKLAAQQPLLFDLHNPLNRADRRKLKTFEVRP